MLTKRDRLSRHADIAKAIDYMLKRWPAFTRFLDDGRIWLSNNGAERALRAPSLSGAVHGYSLAPTVAESGRSDLHLDRHGKTQPSRPAVVPSEQTRAASSALGRAENYVDGTRNERNEDRRCRAQGASSPRLVALSERGSQVLVCRVLRTCQLPESTHKENLYGSSMSTFAAGVFGPAPIPTLRLSLVDCEI